MQFQKFSIKTEPTEIEMRGEFRNYFRKFIIKLAWQIPLCEQYELYYSVVSFSIALNELGSLFGNWRTLFWQKKVFSFHWKLIAKKWKYLHSVLY